MSEAEYIYGRRAVIEALRAAPERVNKLFMAEGTHGRTTDEIRDLARKHRVVIKMLPRNGLDRYAPADAHQGVVASVAPVDYADADALMEANPGGRPALLLALDEITDPQNFGAILRTAEAVGVGGVLIPRHRSVALTPLVAKHSAGASQYVPVARVTNIATLVEQLKECGFQTVGTSGDADLTIYDIDFTVPTAVVVGSEGSGIRPLVRKRCDAVARIPMVGKIESLNASVAAAVVLYEALRQRGGGSKK
jgi:23S rRNA (guanosine2251-2'-O)-methyltransferase